MMTPESHYLIGIAQDVAMAYRELPALRAAMVTGSAAKGLADTLSDIDMTMYYEADLPNDDELDRIRAALGAGEPKWTIGSRESGWFAEAFELNSIEVQVGHTKITDWEKTIAAVLAGEHVKSPAQKAMEGTLNSISLFGDEYMDRWKRQIAAYPATLAHKMIEEHLQFFPIWGLQAHFDSRDATLWFYQSLLDAGHNIIAILAGINRLYFTTFQFKRQRQLIDQMAHKPHDLADRLDQLFTLPPAQSALELERLVGETLDIVDSQMAAVDTSRARRRLGWREAGWQLPATFSITPA